MNISLDKNQPPKAMERAYDLGMNKSWVPRSERQRSTYGSMEISLQTMPGLCEKPKCVRKADHPGLCWPLAGERRQG